jgi:hypothetical protein
MGLQSPKMGISSLDCVTFILSFLSLLYGHEPAVSKSKFIVVEINEIDFHISSFTRMLCYV